MTRLRSLALLGLGAGIAALGTTVCWVGSQSPAPTARQFRARTTLDSRTLEILTAGLDDLLTRADSRGLLRLGRDGDAAVRQRTELKRFLAGFLDYVRGIDSVRRTYDVRANLDEETRAEAFVLAYAAELALYVNTAALLEHTVNHPSYEKIFSESDDEYGIPGGAWRQVKTAFNLQPTQRPLALAQARHLGLAEVYTRAGIDRRHAWAMTYIDRHVGKMIEQGLLSAPKILAREWADLLASEFQRTWFPLQKNVAEWMGDTRFVPADRRLVSDANIEAANEKLRTGDIMLERRNWYLSNVGLPGFWPHAALYLGTPEEAADTLGADAVAHLEREYPDAAAAWRTPDAEGHAPRVLEAVSEGVVFTSLEHSAGADYVAGLRPRLATEGIAFAIERALSYFSRPYDFDFDFRTDTALVCSELIYKAYERGASETGLTFALTETLGRPVLTPNDLVRSFAESGNDGQLAFVFFLDGHESEKTARFGSEEDLRSSWRRPKWDIAQP